MGEMIEFTSNGGTCPGYLASPSSGSGPGVVVLQEWWGLNENIKGIADRLSAQGYFALVPDLYRGAVTAEPDEAGKLMMLMKMDQAGKDMSGAFDYVKAVPGCSGKVGSVGFCLGGGLSLYVSTLRPMDATVIYYGVLPGVQPDLSKLKGPVLGHYADHDDWANRDVANALADQIRAAGGAAEFHFYDGTSHGFFNDTRPDAHDAKASQLTWERTLAFFKQHLA